MAGKKLKFIDETVELSANYDGGLSESDENDQDQQDHNESISTPSIPSAPAPALPFHNQPDAASTDLDLVNESRGIIQPASAGDHLRSSQSGSRIHPWYSPALSGLARDPSTQHYEDYDIQGTPIHGSTVHTSVWPSIACLGACKSLLAVDSQFPVKEFPEAELIRYYVENLAPVFDLCDLEMNFTRTLLEVAGSFRGLLGAIYAVSEKSIGGFQRRTQLRKLCSQCFQAVSSSCDGMLDDSSFAFIVLSHFHERIEGGFSISLYGLLTGLVTWQCETQLLRVAFAAVLLETCKLAIYVHYPPERIVLTSEHV